MPAAIPKLAARSLRLRSLPRTPWPAAELAAGLPRRILLYRLPFRFLIVTVAIVAALGGLAVPYFQKNFLDTLLGYDPLLKTLGDHLGPEGSFDIAWHLVGLIGLTFVAMMASQSAAALLRALCAREGTIAQGQVSEALYAHTLKLSGASRSARTVGELTNLYTQDVAASAILLEDFLPSFLTSVLPFFVAPIAVSIYFNLSMVETGSALLITCSALLAMSFRQARFFGAFKRLAGDRMAIVNEWLQNIRMIRILGWVRDFEARIFQKREEETANRIAMVTNGSTMNSIAQVAPLLLNVVGIVSLIHHHRGHISPGDIFALMWVFGVFLARPVRMLPWTLVIFLDGITSCRRLEQFFLLAEEPDHTSTTTSAPALPLDTTLTLSGLSLLYGVKPVLSDINVVIEPGEFIGITGAVGAGKTQFLMSLLREVPASFNHYSIGDRDAQSMSLQELRANFALIPQDGFVMSASLRDNVAFEYAFRPDRDQRILKSLQLAQFGSDLEKMSAALDTEIGERGVNLSGGQRQRVSLARALFADRPIILLDDSLSAVDVDTERMIIEKLLCGAWASKTRILVTHRLSVLPFVDRIFVMEDGLLKEQRGTKPIS